MIRKDFDWERRGKPVKKNEPQHEEFEEFPDGPRSTGRTAGSFPLSDHVTVRAISLHEGIGGILFTFSANKKDGTREQISEVLFVGYPETLRNMGRLMNNVANSAANHARPPKKGKKK